MGLKYIRIKIFKLKYYRINGLNHPTPYIPIDRVIHGVGNILWRYSTGILPQSAAENALRLGASKIPRALGTLQSMKSVCDRTIGAKLQ